MFEISAAFIYARECNKHLRIEKYVVDGYHATSDYHISIFKSLKILDEKERAMGFSVITQAEAFAVWSCYEIAGNIRMVGFFQYYPPILRHETAIREFFCNNIESVDTSSIDSLAVAIHVRRGDYLHSPDFHYLQPESYYIQAMAIFPENTKFIVFSDDIPWCKTRPMFLKSTISFIEEADEVCALAKMAAAKGGVICANSTFSWWAAFLGAHAVRAPVIVPASRWIALPVTDLFPAEWIKL